MSSLVDAKRAERVAFERLTEILRHGGTKKVWTTAMAKWRRAEEQVRQLNGHVNAGIPDDRLAGNRISR